MAMPGGLTRVAASADMLVTPMAKGGGSKDTWVLSSGPVRTFSLLRPTVQPVELSRAGGDLLRGLQRRRDLTYLFISHDLRVVAALASRVMVMRHGKVVEEGAAAQLFANPQTPYTRALFAAAFNLETTGEGAVAQ